MTDAQEEKQQTNSREDKNKYGTLAYLQRDIRRISELEDINFKLVIDDEEIDVLGYKCYVVNSARAGTGLAISKEFKFDDGMLDIFMLAKVWKSSNAALNRFFNLENKAAGMYCWRVRRSQSTQIKTNLSGQMVSTPDALLSPWQSYQLV